MSLYRAAIRPLLFRLSGDRSHALAHAALRHGLAWRVLAGVSGLAVTDPRLRTRYAGVDLPNPIGLAAGLDKNCELLDALSTLGFGFVTVGSLMPQPRFGNPFPRLVRYPERESLADSMGVPSIGRAAAIENLRRFSQRRVPLFANVGGFSAEEIAAGVLETEPYADATEISLMCPNAATEGFDEIALLREVLRRIEGHRNPVTVRVPNDTTESADRLAELIERCIEGGVAGIKLAGGKRVPEPRLGAKQGTLHGRATFDRGLANVMQAARIANGRIDIKGNGGVFSGADVLAMLRAGAVCVDLFTAFVYEGWAVARKINCELLSILDEHAADSLRALAPAR